MFASVFRSVYRTSVSDRQKFCLYQPASRMMNTTMNGDLNNTAAARTVVDVAVDPSYRNTSFAISASEDDALVREKYRPFLLGNDHSESDWIAQLELSTALKMVDSQILNNGGERLKVLVLYGSMRQRYATQFPTKHPTHFQDN